MIRSFQSALPLLWVRSHIIGTGARMHRPFGLQFDFWATEDDGNKTFVATNTWTCQAPQLAEYMFVVALTHLHATLISGPPKTTAVGILLRRSCGFFGDSIGGVTPVCGCTDPNVAIMIQRRGLMMKLPRFVPVLQEGTVWDEALQGRRC